MDTTTWLITGASRGMGRELVEQLLARGDRVAATARHPEQLDDLAATYGDRLWVRALDVADTSVLRSVVDAAFAELGRVDAVVSNAGAGTFGVAEDLADAQIDALVAANLVGSMQLARAVTPHLRDQGGGVFVQMSSMGGLISFPGFSLYHATKWGIEGFLEALRVEVEPFGIRCVLVEPGIVRTGFFDAAERVAVGEPYRGGPADRPPPGVEDMTDSPERTVAALIRAADDPDSPFRVVLGSDAYGLVTGALRTRLAEIEPQRADAATADG